MPKKNNDKEKKIKIKVTDIVARPQKIRLKKTKAGVRPEADKLIQIEIPQGVKVEEPAIIDVLSESRGEVAKEMAALEQRAEEFEKRQAERFREEERGSKRRGGRRYRKYVITFLILAILGAGGYAAAAYLPKAKIEIAAKKTEWKFNDVVAASKSATDVNIQTKTIPAEVFSQKKNFTFPFAATGKKPVQEPARGTITIYNAYSSDQQPLVASTRFVSPDGKIFRLTKSIVVPGAKIVDGKIVPSSIDADVRADKLGAEYNIGPVSRFKIPGFENTPKYSSFYAESKNPMSGGFIGEVSYPTDQDIKNVEMQARASLKDSIDSFLRLGISPAYVIVGGSEQFNILKETINKDVDASGKASIFLEAEAAIIAFREADLLSLIKSLANVDLKPQLVPGFGDFEILNYKADYANARMNLSQGQLAFSVNWSGNLRQPIDIKDFIQKALGKKESDLRTLIYALPDVEKATISFWPFWVQNVSSRASRVTVEVK